MARARSLLVLAGAAFAAASCTNAPPPELSGLWSAGPAACDAGVGVRFGSGAIEAVYRSDAQVLFQRPRYRVEAQTPFRVRITYQLPRQAGGVRAAGARGVIVLARRSDGSLAPEAHILIDGRTGAARQRIVNDPAVTALTLSPCGAPRTPIEGLRGRGES